MELRGEQLVLRPWRLDDAPAIETASSPTPTTWRLNAFAEKVGFRREGVLRSHLLHPDGRLRDSVMFSLLPGERVK